MRTDILKFKGTYAGTQRLTVTAGTAVRFNVPANAVSALLSVEADATSADASKAIRFSEGATPTSSSGHILGDGTYIDIFGANLKSIAFIGIEAGKSHTVHVTFYS